MQRAKHSIVLITVYISASIVLNAQATNAFPASGNVGIGTASPSYLLTVQATGQDAANIGVNSASTNVASNPGAPLILRNLTATSGNYSALLFYDANDHLQGSLGMMYGSHTGMGQGTFYIEPRIVGTPSSFVVGASGNVGIGTTNPGSKLEVNGNLALTSGSSANITFADGTKQTTAWTGVLCGGDYAEAMNVEGGKSKYQPGDVLVLAAGDHFDVQMSTEPYSTMVAGIYATKPGVVGRRTELANSTNDIPMAMVGVVPTKVNSENGPIRRGDLLVTSSTPGYAMKGTVRSRMLGAVLGKAMGRLDSGSGVIEVLVTLQ